MMKRFNLLHITCMILIIMLCTSCSNGYVFKFSYELDETEWHTGARNTIEITIENASGKDYQYEGSSSAFCAEVKLFIEKDGIEYIIPYEDMPHTMDVGTHIIKNGEERTTMYYFDVPTDAPVGEYHLEVSYENTKEVYENVLQIVE